MKCLIVFLSVFATALAALPSASEFYQLTNFQHAATDIQFDSKGNIFIVANDRVNDYFFCLNSAKDIIIQQNFKLLLKLIVNSKDDVLIFSKDSSDATEINVSKFVNYGPNYRYFVALFKYPIGELPKTARDVIFSDDADNIYFNTDSGVEVLKPSKDHPSAVNNLENFYIGNIDSHVVDNKGNVILAGSDSTKLSVLATISKSEANKTIPSAVKIVNPHPNIEPLVAVKKDSDGIFLAYGDEQAKLYKTHSVKAENYTDKLQLSYHSHKLSNFYSTKNRTFLTAKDQYNEKCYLYSQNLDNKSLPIQIQAKSIIDKPYLCDDGMMAVNDDTLFYAVNDSFYYLRSEDVLPPWQYPLSQKIKAILPDKNHNVLVVATYFHILTPKSVSMTILDLTPIKESTSYMKQNDKTNEIYIASGNKLYVYCSAETLCTSSSSFKKIPIRKEIFPIKLDNAVQNFQK